MKILVAVHGFPPTHHAGAERAAERLALWLAANNHDVQIFTLEKYDSQSMRLETDQYDGIVCYRLHYNLEDSGFGSVLRYDNPQVGSQFREVLKQGDFDLVHIVSGYLLGGQVVQIAHEFGLPVVITLTEYWFMCSRLNLLRADGTICSGPTPIEKCAICVLEERRRYRLANQYLPGVSKLFWDIAQRVPHFSENIDSMATRQESLKAALDDADLVISPSHFLISKYAEFGFNTDQWVMIRHGINDPPQDRLPVQHEQKADVLRVGYIGQLKHHKGIDLVVGAVIRLLEDGKEIVLDIWGSLDNPTTYIKSLQTESAQFPAIRWRGAFQGDQLWGVLDSIDVLVVPSRWYENCPTVILEAYKAKKAVIATDLGGMAELIEHGISGLLFALNDRDDLANQFKKLLDEPGLLGDLKNGIPYVKTGSEEVAEIFEQYEVLLRNRVGRN